MSPGPRGRRTSVEARLWRGPLAVRRAGTFLRRAPAPMDPARWTRLKDALAEILDAPDRDAALARADADLRDDLADLLDADARADARFGAAPALGLAGLADALPRGTDLVGRAVGPYTVEAHVGRGGMGDVYRARRTDGLHGRAVALKLVRADSSAVLARFDAERRILGRLDHPRIARLLDAGAAPDVRPWIAMDFVDGEPITAYADARGLGTAERVRLLAETALVVHAAHQRLVVHRDLKPSNVLVRDGAGGPEPVLLDFGIAKLLQPDAPDGDAPDGGVQTADGERPMTRAYAAPEQLRGEPATTATDVYALGLLLFELLAGRRPFADAESPAAYERAVLHDEPPLPSRVAEATTAAGTTRRAARRLRGDLDTICRTALAKEPAARYASAEALAADLGRYLAGEPVLARRPTAAYRLWTTLRRHRGGVSVAAAAVLVALAAGVGHTRRVTAERDRAEAAQARAEAVAAFLKGLFEAADPADGADASLRDVLDRGAARLDADLADQPETRSDLLRVVGSVYASLGLFEPAEARLAEAVALARGAGAPAVLADALLQIGNLRYRQERGADARAALDEALQLAEAAHGPDAPETATVLNSVALVREALGDTLGALAAYDRVIRIRRAAGPPDHNLAANLSNRASLLHERGDLDAAAAHYDEAARALRADVGPSHPYVAFLLNNRAGVAQDRRAFDAARADLAEALRIARAAFGEAHPFTAVVHHNTGRLERDAGRPAAARAAFERALALRRVLGPPDDPDLRETERELAALGLP